MATKVKSGLPATSKQQSKEEIRRKTGKEVTEQQGTGYRFESANDRLILSDNTQPPDATVKKTLSHPTPANTTPHDDLHISWKLRSS
ncbi:hypothetical protein BLNAU_18163 [Blattamonas nauphoetae]|uniref:Uncharacterized protein n=1 Tax=Blattamonas nauphoetae TaxID=2049346 RepID=A0ABQ9X5A0_9EUKA|nr:hypothetical protein BLNAU_18163 [Blattamonas nauphoetae]